MTTHINNYKKSTVTLGDKLENLLHYIPKNVQHGVIITDTNVEKLYKPQFPDFPSITIQTGEKNKTQKTVDYIVEELLKLGADRHTFLVGIGGGIVCDITGYAASIFMRGLKFGYVPTTLLAQVDASIGGKTGINFKGYKNILGVFSQPQFVLCDIHLLETLPLQEIKSGLMETVKHAIINDPEIFDYILENRQEILAIDKPTLQYLITKSVQTKTAIVTLDEFEKGERKKLNLGHTTGHAIESIEGIPHGYAIAIGIVMTAKISHQLGFCSIETVNKISELIASFGLATDSKTPTHQLIEMIKKDKKKQEDSIDFICIKNIGEVFIQPMTLEELNQNTLQPLD